MDIKIDNRKKEEAMSKTIKNVKLTDRQWELLGDAISYYETVIEDYILHDHVGYSHKTTEALNEMYRRLHFGGQ